MLNKFRSLVQSAPADGESATPLIQRVGSYLFGYNGTTFDRARSGVADFASSQLASVVGTLRSLPLAQYLATRPVMTDTYYSRLMANARGDLATQEQYLPDYEDNDNDVAWTAERAVAASTGGWTNYHSGTTKVGAAGLVIKASGGRLRSLGGANTSGASNYYLVAVNKATAPVNNDATVFAIPLAVTTSWGDSAAQWEMVGGLYLATGLAVAISSTPEKVTLGGSDCVIWARYY